MNEQTETTIVNRCRDWYTGSLDMDASNGWRERARKAMEYYNGTGQWENAVVNRLKQEGRPALTINKILPTINVVWGQQLKNATEITLSGEKGESDAVAAMGSQLIKHAMDYSNGVEASGDAYRDGLITGKGWVSVDHVFGRDPLNGALLIEAVSPLTIFEDPRNMAYDANGGEFLFRERPMTLNELQARYPKKYADALAASAHDWSGDANYGTKGWRGLLSFMRQILGREEGNVGDSGAMRTVTVRECWHKVWEKQRIAHVSLNGRTISGKIRNRADEVELREAMKNARDGEFAYIRDSVSLRMDLAVMVGDCLVWYQKDGLNGCTNYPYVRYSPYWLHGEAMGVVDNLMGLQDELNKRRSSLLHDANINGNPGWIGGTPTERGWATINNFASTPGGYICVDDFRNGNISRIQPGSLSPAHAGLAELSESDIREVSGANPDIMGTRPEQSESGRARLIRQEAGQTTLAPVVSNFFRAQGLLGETVWEIVRNNNIFRPEQVLAIVDDETLAELGGPRGAVDAMNNWDVGSFAVKATVAKVSTTWRGAQLEELNEFNQLVRGMGMQLPPDVNNAMIVKALELADFPGAQRMAKMLKEQPATPSVAGAVPGPANRLQGTPTGAVLAASGGQPQ